MDPEVEQAIDQVVAVIAQAMNEDVAPSRNKPTDAYAPLVNIVCRLCARFGNDVIHICGGDAQKIGLLRVLRTLNVPMGFEDNLPKTICYQCCRKLLKQYKFRTRVGRIHGATTRNRAAMSGSSNESPSNLPGRNHSAAQSENTYVRIPGTNVRIKKWEKIKVQRRSPRSKTSGPSSLARNENGVGTTAQATTSANASTSTAIEAGSSTTQTRIQTRSVRQQMMAHASTSTATAAESSTTQTRIQTRSVRQQIMSQQRSQVTEHTQQTHDGETPGPSPQYRHSLLQPDEEELDD